MIGLRLFNWLKKKSIDNKLKQLKKIHFLYFLVSFKYSQIRIILNMTDPWLHTKAIISINHKWFHSVRIIVNTFACKCFSPWMCFRPYSAEHKEQRKTLVKPWCSMSELLLTNNLKAFKLFCLLDYFFKWKTNFLFLMDFWFRIFSF